MMQFKSLSNEQRGVLYAVTSGLCYGLLGYFGMTIVNANFSVANATFWRFFVSSIVLCIFIATKHKLLLENPLKSILMLGCGMFLYCPGSMLYFVSSQYIGTGLAIVIFFTFPVFVMLINWYFFDIKMSAIYQIAIALIIIGLVLLVDFKELRADTTGVVLSFISAITYACYVIMSKKNLLHPLLATCLLSIGCAFTSFLYAFFDDSFRVPREISIWFDILCLGIICTALPIVLLLQSLKYISSEKVSILSVLEPVAIVLVGITILGEQITVTQSFGIVIILAAAMITAGSSK